MELMENKKSSPVEVELTISRKPKIQEAVIDEDTGKTILPEVYASTSSVDKVAFAVQLRELPTIN